MRDYHRKRSGITRGMYYRVKGLLMDYDMMKKDCGDILHGTRYVIAGMPSGGGISDPTEQRGIKLANIGRYLEAIDQAAVLMRAERGNKVWEAFDPIKAYWSYDYFNLQHKRTDQSPDGPCRRSWNNFKDRFSEAVAQKL